MMTSTPAAATSAVPVALRQRHDPVLAELWQIKAEMNAQAGYDVRQLLENAHQQVLAMKAAGLLAAGKTDREEASPAQHPGA